MLASLPLIKVLIVESPRFHPHSWWSYLPRCRLVSSIANGCCHLGTELPLLAEVLRSEPDPQSPELDDLPSTISVTMLLFALLPVDVVQGS